MNQKTVSADDPILKNFIKKQDASGLTIYEPILENIFNLTSGESNGRGIHFDETLTKHSHARKFRNMGRLGRIG